MELYMYLTTLGSPIFYDIFLKLRPEIKTTVIPKLNLTLCDPKMCPQTKFWIPMSNNIGFMLVTQFFLDLRAEVKVGYPTLRDPIIIRFLINMQVQGHHPHQWAPFQVTG